MMTKEQAKIGTKVKSNVDFSGVPKGTIGIIDDHYGTDGEILGVMVAWDLPDNPLPKGYQIWPGYRTLYFLILRDGFSIKELIYLDLVDGN